MPNMVKNHCIFSNLEQGSHFKMSDILGEKTFAESSSCKGCAGESQVFYICKTYTQKNPIHRAHGYQNTSSLNIQDSSPFDGNVIEIISIILSNLITIMKILQSNCA